MFAFVTRRVWLSLRAFAENFVVVGGGDVQGSAQNV
jgi:hypothetical protein